MTKFGSLPDPLNQPTAILLRSLDRLYIEQCVEGRPHVHPAQRRDGDNLPWQGDE